ncbi:hypothetical protein C479_00682 [Halovivax asiaticus JCM 14624]|uniref:DUF354 domain-containing protein n=1 Tax=Halovivax asiaticus JCM 14624 TaxID=1227490 RepID=M0BTC5_9EURY|nr:DUF354 domain-containing protein [Halovivax asiaticus]ELZ14200.1 hypothetical protein C479_00682 [Halovivax asiaticus JCM 14624]
MKIVVTIQHPAHVHFYRHAVKELDEQGHDVFVYARENDLAVPLLEAYGIEHEVLAGPQRSLASLARVQAIYEWRLLTRARRIDPDVMTSIGGVAVSHVAPLVDARSVVFVDNEGVWSHRLMASFADVIATPASFEDDFGEGHVRYRGFQELAYLHPNRFEPDPDRLRAAGVDPSDRYFFCRFRTWDAFHDVGQGGLSPAGKRELVSRFDDRGTVYISSSDPLPPDLEPYRQPIPPTAVHDLLYYADCYAGDSATMATEAALLGTPAVRIQSFATDFDADMSNFVVLETEYDLLRSTADESVALALADELSADPKTPARWKRRRDAVVDDLQDGTTLIVDLLTREARARPSQTADAAYPSSSR